MRLSVTLMDGLPSFLVAMRHSISFASIAVALSCFAQGLSAQLSIPNLGSAGLSFSVSSGSNDNYFLRDNATSAQLLLTSGNASATQPRRLVVALPAGNTGALTYFIPQVNSSDWKDFDVSVIKGTFTSTTEEFNNSGIQADLSFIGNASLGVTIIGAVRAMRGAVCFKFVNIMRLTLNGRLR